MRRLGLLLVALLLPMPAAGQSLIEQSPLAACPDTPNCTHVARTFEAPPDTVRAAAQAALRALGPLSVRLRDDGTFAAVYRVALVFKDDMTVAVAPHETGSVLFVRSASRVGYSDLGVNDRRVQRFLRKVRAQL
ncbi:DUF1499 domain-containing protein [Salisaeta longa]|uniref:DUF1499 domain-containing protein n=1 Tax=Salisaeta longa TaxID=503170 RepID=UPI0003F63619|nr:DUF1499 domain-containing protein [Salisaeta longa]